MRDFGDYLKELRKDKSLSIRKASEKIGISHTYLDSLEKGYDPRTKKARKPTPEVLQKISDFYKVNYEYLLFSAGYIPEETYNRQIKLKKELEERQKTLINATQNYRKADMAFNSLLKQHEAYKEEILQSDLDEEEIISLVKDSNVSMENVRKKSITAAENLKATIQDIETLEERYKSNINLLSLGIEEGFDIGLIEKLADEKSDKAIENYEYVRNLIGKTLYDEFEFEIEKLFSDKTILTYNAHPLSKEEKRKVLSIINTLLEKDDE